MFICGFFQDLTGVDGSAPVPECGAAGLSALDLLRAVQAVLTDDTILIIDRGNIGHWAPHKVYQIRLSVNEA